MFRSRFPHRSRLGFTLVELLVVLSIIVVVAAVTIPLAIRLNEGAAIRDSARTVQAVLAGARDRALAQQIPFGVRLQVANNDRELVHTLQYIRQADPIAGQSCIVTHLLPGGGHWPSVLTPATLPSAVFAKIVFLDADTERFSELPITRVGTVDFRVGLVRLDDAGPARPFFTSPALLADASGYPCGILGGVNLASGAPNDPMTHNLQPLPYPAPFGSAALADSNGAGTALVFAGPNAGGTDSSYNNPYYPTQANGYPVQTTKRVDPATRIGMTYKIIVGNKPTADDIVNLSNGIAIDLGQFVDANADNIADDPPYQRLTRLAQTDTGQWDIMFSPNGQVIGTAANTPEIILWVREEVGNMRAVPVGTAAPVGTISGTKKLVPTVGVGRHVLVVVYTKSGSARSVDVRLINNVQDQAPGAATPDGFFDFASYFDFVYNPEATGL